jgi:6-phosphogluconate dehydrogenase
VQVDDGPCVMHVGPGGAGNFVKMVHNGIEYGDMQLISEAYDILRTVGGFTNDELAETFTLWNKVLLAYNASRILDMTLVDGNAQ